MKLVVIGTGYVGLVAGACFAAAGNHVVCVDTDAAKVERLKAGIIPIYEPGLETLVARSEADGRLRFTTELAEALDELPDVVILAVGTPPGEDGSADMRHVLAAAAEVGRGLRSPAVIAVKSTVPVGSSARIRDEIARNTDIAFWMCSNPEFLKEGAAVEDFMKPDRVIIGVDAAEARELMTELYAPFTRKGGDRLIVMDITSAEVTKYAANAMLATRISFINQIAELCEAVGADVGAVRNGIGSDQRIGRAFLYPGPGYGGSCFPKDVKALIHRAAEVGVDLELLRSVETVNHRQRQRVLSKVLAQLDPKVGRPTVAIWGLAFKAETDDVRESASLDVVAGLVANGVIVRVHDPKAMDAARRVLGDRVTYAADAFEAALGADALVVMTEWMEYRTPDFPRLLEAMRKPVIIDARNLYDPERVQRLGFHYRGVGRGRA